MTVFVTLFALLGGLVALYLAGCLVQDYIHAGRAMRALRRKRGQR